MTIWSWKACAAAIAVAAMAGAANAATPSITYSVHVGDGGALVLAADAGVLQIEKSIFDDGRTTVVLKSDRDELTIAIDRDGATIVSGDSRVSVNAAQPDEATFGRTRALLARSKAARLFRDLIAALDRRDESASVYDKMLFVTGAEMSRFEGDSSATETLGKRLGAKKDGKRPIAAGVRPVSCGVFRRVQFPDCVSGYESAVMGAWRSWDGCFRGARDGAPWYLQNAELWFCDVELFFRLESSAMQFLRCVAIPL